MTNTKFKDHFSTGSADYAAYRPTYPMALVDELVKISPGHKQALDCGCGTGQLSVLLAQRFDAVLATDASATQITQAQQHLGVTYRTALAEDSRLPDGSVDLITVAQAAHWLDLESFYREVYLVARPGAAVALITYGVLHIEGEVDSAIQHFYYDTINAYWPVERRYVDEGYRQLPFPFREVAFPALVIGEQWRLDDLLGYVRTWSAVKIAEKTLGRSLVEPLREQLSRNWGDPETRRKITWSLSLRAGNVVT